MFASLALLSAICYLIPAVSLSQSLDKTHLEICLFPSYSPFSLFPLSVTPNFAWDQLTSRGQQVLIKNSPIMAKTLTLNTTDMAKPSVPFPVYYEPEDLFEASIGSRFEYNECPNKMAVPEHSDMASAERPVHKLLDQVSRTPGRMPSPQPTHFTSSDESLPYKNGNGNGHRVLRSATVGYIAPEFEGKKAQKTEGELCKYQYIVVCGP